MKTLTTQPTQNPIDLPQAQAQPAIDPMIALLLYFSVLLPLVNQNLKNLLELRTTLQKLHKIWKSNCLKKQKRSKK